MGLLNIFSKPLGASGGIEGKSEFKRLARDAGLPGEARKALEDAMVKRGNVTEFGANKIAQELKKEGLVTEVQKNRIRSILREEARSNRDALAEKENGASRPERKNPAVEARQHKPHEFSPKQGISSPDSTPSEPGQSPTTRNQLPY